MEPCWCDKLYKERLSKVSNTFGRAIVRIFQEPPFMYVRSQVLTRHFTIFDRDCLEPELNQFMVLSVPRSQLVKVG